MIGAATSAGTSSHASSSASSQPSEKSLSFSRRQTYSVRGLGQDQVLRLGRQQRPVEAQHAPVVVVGRAQPSSGRDAVAGSPRRRRAARTASGYAAYRLASDSGRTKYRSRGKNPMVMDGVMSIVPPGPRARYGRRCRARPGTGRARSRCRDAARRSDGPRRCDARGRRRCLDGLRRLVDVRHLEQPFPDGQVAGEAVVLHDDRPTVGQVDRAPVAEPADRKPW